MSFDTDTAEFERHRPMLHGVAYRMTASHADANDLVQETWLRWQRVDRSSVDNAEAFLVRTITNLSIDQLRSATTRRVNYVGPYLPEPLLADAASDVEGQAELADSLTFSFLVLLDSLSEVERAVVLLHDVFGYPFDEVAAIVDRAPAAVRQVAKRARDRLRGASERGTQLPAAHGTHPAPKSTIESLLVLLALGDVDGVLGLLAPEVIALSDGGANRKAARYPLVGPDRVTRFWMHLAKRYVDFGIEITSVNAAPGIVVREPDGTLYMTATIEVNDAGQIVRIYSQLNPDKLAPDRLQPGGFGSDRFRSET